MAGRFRAAAGAWAISSLNGAQDPTWMTTETSERASRAKRANGRAANSPEAELRQVGTCCRATQSFTLTRSARQVSGIHTRGRFFLGGIENSVPADNELGPVWG